MIRLTRLRSRTSSVSFPRGSETRYCRQGSGLNCNGRFGAAASAATTGYQHSHFMSTTAKNTNDSKLPERSSSLPPQMLQSRSFNERQRSAKTNEVLERFFNNRRHESSPLHNPEPHAIHSASAETSSPVQEKLKTEILRKFFAKRPTVQRPVHAQTASTSETQSRLLQTLKSSLGPRVAGLEKPDHGHSNLGATENSIITTATRNPVASDIRPRFSLSRPPTHQYKQPQPQPSTQPPTTDPADVTALRLALFGDKRQRSRATLASETSSLASQSGSPPLSPARKHRDFDSSLPDFIRRIQDEQVRRAEETAAALKEQQQNGAMAPPLPLWRQKGGSGNSALRSMRKKLRKPSFVYDRAERSWANSEEEEEKPKPVFVQPKDRVVLLPHTDVTLTEASILLRKKVSLLQNVLRRKLGVTVNESKGDANVIDPETMELLAMELNITFDKVAHSSMPTAEEVLLLRRAAAVASSDTTNVAKSDLNATDYASLPPRPPVVCILGHVDHGKTTLMDALRRRAQRLRNPSSDKGAKKKKTKSGKATDAHSNVAGTEAGGITQIISAFQVPLFEGSPEATAEQETSPAVTFLDTPGHAAFKAMRQSGSDAADIIVLVVAADDGVSAQTVEILDFYKSIVEGAGIGGISLVVAMNKIDKPGVDVEESRRRIENQLLEHGILVEGTPNAGDGKYGPPVQLIPISGLTGAGIDNLVEGLMLQAEVMDLRADDKVGVEGVVMDARVVKGVGVVVDCIVRWGSISKGDIVVSGTNMGRVRALKDMSDRPCSKGLPSQPVRIVGFDSPPKAGDPIIYVESEEAANDLIARRMASASGQPSDTSDLGTGELQSSGRHMMNDTWKSMLQVKHGLDPDRESILRIPVVVKADADGTLAAICAALVEIGEESRHNVVIEPIKVGVGPVLASDVQLAKESGATIVCFNGKPDQGVARMAEDDSVPLIRGNVIYSLLDEAREVFAGFMPIVPVELVHGRAEVQATYAIAGVSDAVAGLRVTEGKLYRAKSDTKLESRFRVLRKGEVVSQPELCAGSLKHFKEDVDEVGREQDCGLSLIGYSDFQAGDVIECFSIEQKRQAI